MFPVEEWNYKFICTEYICVKIYFNFYTILLENNRYNKTYRNISKIYIRNKLLIIINYNKMFY